MFLAWFFHRTDGIGLSAPQVGINVQLMVFNPVGERGEGKEIVLVNPRVSRYSQKTRLFNEGCLSFPGIYADVQVLFVAFQLRSHLKLNSVIVAICVVQLHAVYKGCNELKVIA